MPRIRTSAAKAALLDALTDDQANAFFTALAAGYKAEQITGQQPDYVQLAVKQKPVYPKPFTGGSPDNVFVIGDLHAPFIRPGYLEWCLEQQKKWNCGRVVFIGDICDFHAISFHEHDPDGMSAGQELDATRNALQKVFAMFPTADCLLGNHDLLVSRKARAAGLSQRHVKTIAEIYDAPPTWSFHYELEIASIRYQHGGAGGNAERVTKESRISTVQGHFHTQAGISWHVSERDGLFALQSGCGIDDKAYAFSYGKPFPKKSVIGAAAVLDKGKTPLSLLMPL